jgi:hypothetical protein
MAEHCLHVQHKNRARPCVPRFTLGSTSLRRTAVHGSPAWHRHHSALPLLLLLKLVSALAPDTLPCLLVIITTRAAAAPLPLLLLRPRSLLLRPRLLLLRPRSLSLPPPGLPLAPSLLPNLLPLPLSLLLLNLPPRPAAAAPAAAAMTHSCCLRVVGAAVGRTNGAPTDSWCRCVGLFAAACVGW